MDASSSTDAGEGADAGDGADAAMGSDASEVVDGGNPDGGGATCAVMVATTSDDTAIFLSDPLDNHGGATLVQTTRNGGLLRFDLSGIPAGITVAAATLSLYVDGDLGAMTWVAVHEMLAGNAGWVEGRGDWSPAIANEPCFNYINCLAMTPWAGGTGVDDPGIDIRATPEDTVGARFASGTRYMWEIRPALVQRWLDTPGSNHGLVLSESSGYHVMFASKEHGVATRPQLIIQPSCP